MANIEIYRCPPPIIGYLMGFLLANQLIGKPEADIKEGVWEGGSPPT